MNATTNVQLTKEIVKNISKLNHYTEEQFIRDCEEWVKAIKENRTMCIVESVSSSGMSRCFKYITYIIGERGYFRSWYCFLSALGYSFKKETHAIRVGGCGMDMNFHTTYTIANRLANIGVITKEDCEKLAQQTPTIK